MSLKEGYAYGNVTVGESGFYGVNAQGLEEYIEDINSNVIEVAKNHLKDNEQMMFDALRKGWKGLSEARFEELFSKLRDKTQKQLEAAEAALKGELYSIANAWVEQDQNMIIGE